MVRQYHQPPQWYRAAHFFCRDFFPFRKCQFQIAFPVGLMCVLFLTGCDSGSTIDSVMSNGGTAVAPSSPTSPTVAPTPNPGLASPSGPSTETIGSSNNLRDTLATTWVTYQQELIHPRFRDKTLSFESLCQLANSCLNRPRNRQLLFVGW